MPKLPTVKEINQRYREVRDRRLAEGKWMHDNEVVRASMRANKNQKARRSKR